MMTALDEGVWLAWREARMENEISSGEIEYNFSCFTSIKKNEF